MTAPATIDAVHCEAKKHAYRQTQDGVVVSFVLHPQEVPDGLATANLGTRYMLALVEIGDNEEPKTKAPVNPLVQRCAILCGDEEFQAFIKHTYPLDWEALGEDVPTIIRERCGVKSRRELATNAEAAAAFNEILRRFEGWKRGYE